MRFVRTAALIGVAAFVVGASVSACAKDETPAATPVAPVQSDVPLGSPALFHRGLNGFEVTHRDLFAGVSPSGEVHVTREGSRNTLAFHTELGRSEQESSRFGTVELSLRGAVEHSSGDVVERVEMRDDGVELSWLFGKRPSPVDDFVVRHRFSSRTTMEKVSDGVRFPAERLRLSHATWIDAHGRTIRIPAEVRGDTVEYRIASSVLQSSAFPAVLDPTISSEGTLDPSSVAGYASQRGTVQTESDFSSVSVAFDGTNYFAAWFDSRGMNPVLLGALVSQSGILLNTDEIVLGATTESKSRYFNQYGTRVVRTVAGPGGFLVTWSGAPVVGYEVPMFAQRVTSAGKVVDTTPLQIERLPLGDLIGYSATSEFFVLASASYTTATEQTLSISFLNSAAVADPGLRTVRTNATANLAKDGFEFRRVRAAGDLVVYATRKSNSPGPDIYATYTMKVGKTVSAPVQVTALDGDLLDVARDSTQAYVLGENAGGSETQLRTLANDGASVGAASNLGFNTRELFADDLGLLTRYPGNNTACRFTKTLVPSGACFSLSSGVMALGSSTLAVAASTFDFVARGDLPVLTFWNRTTGLASTPARTVLPRSSNSQASPSIAYDALSDRYLAAWVDDSEGDASIDPGATDGGTTTGGSGGLRLMAAIVQAKDGKAVADTAFRVTSAGAESISAPKVVSHAGQFLVAWSERRQLNGTSKDRVMSSTVRAADKNVSAPVVIGSPSDKEITSVAVAADATGWTFAWSEDSKRILAKRWSFMDVAPNPEAPISVSSSDEAVRADVSAVFDGKQTLVAWLEGPNFVSSHVQGIAFLDGSAVPSSTSFTLDSSFSPKERLHLATDGNRTSLATWASYTGGAVREIRAKLISGDNLVLGDASRSVSVAPPSDDDNAYPTAAYSNDKETFVVAWSRRRGGSGDWDILGNWIALDGRVLDAAPGRLVSGTTAAAVDDAGGATEAGEDESLPELCTGSTSTTGLAYVRFDSRSPSRSLRARFRTLSSGRVSGELCGANDDCASRYCVNGICCRSACSDGCGQCAGEGGSQRGQCAPKKSGTTCGTGSRFICSGASTSCPTSCVEAESTNVCAAGLVCRDAQCSPFAAECFDDFHALTQTGPVSCGGYRCQSGACAAVCASADDCEPGNVCDFGGRCGPAPSIENPPGGCSVRSASRSGSATSWLAGIVGAVVLLRRARRGRKGVRATF